MGAEKHRRYLVIFFDITRVSVPGYLLSFLGDIAVCAPLRNIILRVGATVETVHTIYKWPLSNGFGTCALSLHNLFRR